jgi:hypothetical protein
MNSFKVENNDIVRENGNPVKVSDKEAYLQRLKHGLKTLLGEIPWAENLGLPWLSIFEKPINIERVAIEIVKVLNKDPDTTSTTITNLEVNDKNRTFKLNAKLVSVYGSVELNI